MPSATIHKRFADTARRLIHQHGRSMQLVVHVRTGPSYRPEITESAVPIVAVQLAYSARDIAGTDILATDVRFLIDSDIAIDKTMSIIDDGVRYRIESIANNYKPGTLQIMYDIQGRI